MVDEILSPREREQQCDWTAETLLHAWSQKEAFVKAMGTGFKARPNTYEVSHLNLDEIHDMGAGRFWRCRQYPACDDYWITLGVLADNQDVLENWTHTHQKIDEAEFL